ncbi:MAG: hypothetical protein JSR20_14725 [Nitrospira sp.]|nr:hypothetical protein [Nitrospira sp.]
MVGFITLSGALVFWSVGQRVAFLKTPRTLNQAQIEGISHALRETPKAEFQVTSWADSEESANFGGLLTKALKDAGWESRGMTRFYMGDGEAPPKGVIVMASALGHEETRNSAKNLVAVLSAIGVQEVQFSTKITKPLSPTMILIEVGKKP